MVAAPQGRITAVIRDASGHEIARAEAEATAETSLTLEAPGAALWSPEAPNLHHLDLTLTTPEGQDQTSTRFGFRKVVFSPEGFFLNGKRIKLRGLNRHQSFPYIGYALGKAAQIKDAEGPPNCKGWEKTDDALTRAVQQVVLSGADPKKALATAAEKLNKALK